MTTYDLGKVTGDDGNGIASISKTSTSGKVDTYTITFTNGNTATFTVTNGNDGAKGDTGSKGDKGDKGDTGDTGNGIASITLISTSGKVKTYRILYTDGNHFDFQVTDGNDGSSATVDIVTSWNSTTSDSKVPSEKLAKDSLDDKVSKSSTTGLLKNDGTVDTTSYSTFDGNYNNLSNKPTIPSASSTTPSADTSSGSYGSGTSYARSNHSHPKSSLYAESSHTHTKSQITDFPSLSTVATSGSYSDLSNKPSIPSSSSDLSDGSDLVKKSSTTGLIKNDGSIDTNSYLTTSSASSTYQTKLVSGTSIKTVNNESLLGSGNITIQGGSSVDIVTAWEQTLSDTKVPSEKLTKTTINKLGDIDTPTQYNTTIFGSDTEYGDDVTLWDILYCDLADGHKLYYYKNGNANDELATLNDIPSLSNYIQKSSTTGLLKNDGSVDTNTYLTSSAITGMLTTGDVVDNLTSTSATAPLSAKQGKVLNDLIGSAIAYINQ